MRLLWTQDLVTYHGKHVVLDEVALHPRPARSIPIWTGGGNFDTSGMPLDVTIRRAARLADGFKIMAPLGIDLDGMLRLVDCLTERGLVRWSRCRVVRDGGTLGHPCDTTRAVGCHVRAIREAGVSHFDIANRIVAGTVADQIALITRASPM